MKLTKRSEYALLALVYLNRHCSEGYNSIESVSISQAIPKKFLEQILLTLKHGCYVSSYKGQNGGYKLAKSAKDISLAEIIRLFDGALAPTESVSKYFYEPTPIIKEDKIIGVLKDIRDYISNKLENTAIEDVT